jgi:hypothetical protein
MWLQMKGIYVYDWGGERMYAWDAALYLGQFGTSTPAIKPDVRQAGVGPST